MVLHKKMVRDIRRNIPQFITIFLMILIGVMAYTGIESYMLGMRASADRFYEECNLQDLDAYGELDCDDLEQIRGMNHVLNAEGKYTVLANIEDFDNHKAELNFISTNDICRIHIVEGEPYGKDKTGFWLDSFYAENAGIDVGDTLHITYQALDITAPVLGLCNVPDHVYDTKDETEIFPSHTDYGFLYLPSSMMTDAFLSEEGITRDTYTSIMVDLDSTENADALRSAIRDEVANAQMVMDIHDEPSEGGYQREIEEGDSYVGIFSGLFIFIALLSVITTMTRVVHRERMQIGTMKALGYSTRAITWHYISYGLILSILGGICGLLLGYFGLGHFFLGMEMEYYEVPGWSNAINPSSYFIFVLCIVLTCVASYLTARKLLHQPAAELLRVERPKVQQKSLRFTTGERFRSYSFATRWNLRDILRNKARTITTLVGIAGCMILMVAGLGMRDSIHNYLKLELNDINHYEYRMNLSPSITVPELMDLFETYTDHTSMSLNIEVDDPDEGAIVTSAYVDDSKGSIQILNARNKPMKLSSYGVYVTRKFAKLHGYQIGDTITWRINGLDNIFQSEIIGLNRDPQNQNMTMTRYYYQRLGIPYYPDSAYTDEDIQGQSIPGVSTIQSIDAVSDGVNDMLATMNSMILLIIFFAAVLAVVILYNMGILSFSEKDYQFATLKVLGFSDSKIGRLFRQQNLWITVVAIIIGLPLGYFITDFIFQEAIGDVYDFAAHIKLPSYLIAAAGTFIVSYLVTIFLNRKIRDIDMVQSLKSNE